MDLGLIGNCAVAALVDRDATINWFCLPRLDGDPVFHGLVGHGAQQEGDGEFAVELEGMTVSEQTYLSNSAILNSTADRHVSGRDHRFLPSVSGKRT